MDVRLPKIETPYAGDETGPLPVADFRERPSSIHNPTSHPPFPPIFAPSVLIEHAPARPLADVITSLRNDGSESAHVGSFRVLLSLIVSRTTEARVKCIPFGSETV